MIFIAWRKEREVEPARKINKKFGKWNGPPPHYKSTSPILSPPPQNTLHLHSCARTPLFSPFYISSNTSHISHLSQSHLSLSIPPPMEDNTTSSTKRPRPSSEEEDSPLSGESPATSSPELKRLRRVSAEDYLFNILDDDDSTESQEIDDGLASVMHSLEQEIRSGNGNGSESEQTGTAPGGDKAASAQELGYLLEASDDELGIPPAAEESPANLAGDVVDLTGADAAESPAMYGQIWGFDDDIGFGSDFAFRPETGDDGLGFGSVGYDDVGLFDHSEPSDLTWRTMPAA